MSHQGTELLVSTEDNLTTSLARTRVPYSYSVYSVEFNTQSVQESYEG